MVITELLARVIDAIPFTSVRWRLDLHQRHKLVLGVPALLALRFKSHCWRAFAQHSFHMEL